MKRARLVATLIASVLVIGACYRVTVVTGAPPANNKIDLPWQKSFVFGLVPPDTIRAKSTCGNGVSQVIVEQSFLNALVAALTSSLFTPIHPVVTCATSPRPGA